MKHNKKNIYEQKIEEKLHLAKRISLSVEEKDRMSVFLSSYVGLHPVLGEQERVLLERRKRRPVITAVFRLMPAFVVALFFIGGGAVLAERSLPGDTLYGFKIGSENIRRGLSFDMESRARFGATRVERRLDEGQKLAVAGALTEKTAHELIKNLEENVAELEHTLATLKARDNKPLVAFEIGEGYRSSVRVYRELLTKMSKNNADAGELIREIALRLDLKENVAMNMDARSLGANEEEGAPEFFLMASDEGLNEEDAISDDADDSETANLMVPRSVEGTEGVNAGGMSEDIAVDILSSEKMGTLSFMQDGEPSLPIATIELFVSTRIEKTEDMLEASKRLDSSMKKNLSGRLKEARNMYSDGVRFYKEGNENEARVKFNQSIDIVEDIQTILRISESKNSEVLLRLLLSKIEVQDESQNVEVLDSLLNELEGEGREPPVEGEDMLDPDWDEEVEEVGVPPTTETTNDPLLETIGL